MLDGIPGLACFSYGAFSGEFKKPHLDCQSCDCSPVVCSHQSLSEVVRPASTHGAAVGFDHLLCASVMCFSQQRARIVISRTGDANQLRSRLY